MNRKPFFWWTADNLTYRWKLIYRGMDEYHWRTLGIRLPFGVLFYRTSFDYEAADETENLRVWGVPNPPEGLTGVELNLWNET